MQIDIPTMVDKRQNTDERDRLDCATYWIEVAGISAESRALPTSLKLVLPIDKWLADLINLLPE